MGRAARLAAEVRAFEDALVGPLEGLATVAGLDPSRAAQDVAEEARALVGALMAADGRVADLEAQVLVEVFGPRLGPPPGGTSPDAVRRLLATAAGWLEAPSPLVGLLAAADARDGTALVEAYRDRAVAIATATAALDGYTDRVELAAVDRFRALLDRVIAGGHGTASPAARRGVASVEGRDDPPRPLADVLAELDGLIGLDAVKAEVRRTADLLQVERLRAERGLPVLPRSRHLVFTGNPGTGKTTVARLIAALHRSLGALPRGHLVETDRAGLVAGYVGQTAARVTEVVDAADGGVLLIDEAYALARGGEQDFGAEAVDALVKLVEDRRDRLVVILTGYPEEMEDLLDSNPGLRSRFPTTIAFPDYATGELVAIATAQAERSRYRLTAAAAERLEAVLDATPRERGFGNGRLARNLFEAAVARHASRIVAVAAQTGVAPTDEALMTIDAEDVPGP